MARIWTERFNPERHLDFMSTTQIGGSPYESMQHQLIERQVFFVAVAGFTFEFHSLDQIKLALTHFETKIHPSSALPGITLEHYWQRWYERLPQWLFEEPRRVRVVSALRRASRHFERLTDA